MVRSDLPGETEFSLHPDQDQARRDAARLFTRIAAELRRVFPEAAEIRHVGATAVPGCLTKGDLDIVVRVPADGFAEADRMLAAKFARNAGSKRTESFSAFEDPTTAPHLGIQLAVRDGEDDCFHLFVEALLREPELVVAYNALKQSFDGQPMDVYRAAKSAFIRDVLSRQAD